MNGLLKLFRDISPKEIDRIMGLFKGNEELRLQGYGWKGVIVKCGNINCDWRGKRIWGEKMFDKKCPSCGWSVSCPVRLSKE